jgi:hypothetical protein
VKRLLLILSLTAAVLAVSTGVQPTARSQQAAEQHALESFSGSWVRAQDRREQEAMYDSFDRVVEQMNVFVREIARLELRRRVVPEERIRVTVLSEDDVSCAFDNWAVRARLDGTARGIRGPEGEQIRSSLRFDDGRIVERRSNGQGERVNVLSLSQDAQRLILSVRISSVQLPDAIRFRLTYRRE